MTGRDTGKSSASAENKVVEKEEKQVVLSPEEARAVLENAGVHPGQEDCVKCGRRKPENHRRNHAQCKAKCVICGTNEHPDTMCPLMRRPGYSGIFTKKWLQAHLGLDDFPTEAAGGKPVPPAKDGSQEGKSKAKSEAPKGVPTGPKALATAPRGGGFGRGGFVGGGRGGNGFAAYAGGNAASGWSGTLLPGYGYPPPPPQPPYYTPYGPYGSGVGGIGGFGGAGGAGGYGGYVPPVPSFGYGNPPALFGGGRGLNYSAGPSAVGGGRGAPARPAKQASDGQWKAYRLAEKERKEEGKKEQEKKAEVEARKERRKKDEAVREKAEQKKKEDTAANRERERSPRRESAGDSTRDRKDTRESGRTLALKFRKAKAGGEDLDGDLKMTDSTKAVPDETPEQMEDFKKDFMKMKAEHEKMKQAKVAFDAERKLFEEQKARSEKGNWDSIKLVERERTALKKALEKSQQEVDKVTKERDVAQAELLGKRDDEATLGKSEADRKVVPQEGQIIRLIHRVWKKEDNSGKPEESKETGESAKSPATQTTLNLPGLGTLVAPTAEGDAAKPKFTLAGPQQFPSTPLAGAPASSSATESGSNANLALRPTQTQGGLDELMEE